MTTRRSVLTILAGLPMLAAVPAEARDGFVVDWGDALPDPAVARFLEAQIRILEALPISDAAMAFFRAETIHVDEGEDTRTRAFRQVHMARRVQDPDNPVLLHELIHRWQIDRMRGARDPDVVRLWEAARASGRFPANSYMLSNPMEFFAMVASVVLHGRAARPPFTRETVRRDLPEAYAFVIREFGFRGG